MTQMWYWGIAQMPWKDWIMAAIWVDVGTNVMNGLDDGIVEGLGQVWWS